MAVHKNRSGERIVCHYCQVGECTSCMGADLALDGALVCHCSCQPECTVCWPSPTKHRRISSRQACPNCFTALLVSRVCGVCNRP